MPEKRSLNKAAQARRNAESKALHEVSRQFKTGPNANPSTKRARTRSAANKKAITDFDN
jgi:hypothetical protein